MFETAFRLCHFAVSGTISLIDRVLDSDPEGDSDDTGTVEDRNEDAEAASRLSAAAAGRLLPPAGGHSLSARAGRGQHNAAMGAGVSLAPPVAAGRTRARRRVITLQVRTSSSSCSTAVVGRHSPLVVLSHTSRTTSHRRSLLSSRRRRGSKYVPHLEVIPEERDSLMEDVVKVRGHYWEDSLLMLQKSSQMAGGGGGLRARA